MKISPIMSISRILIDLYAIRQKNESKKHFCRCFEVFHVLIVKTSCKNIKKFVWR